jgi:PAS domain S-box-containing protein
VVIITGRATVESAIAAVESRAVGYMQKPLDPGRVLALVARVFERRRLARENAELQVEIKERLRESEALLAITRAVDSTPDLTEALRRLCRELTRMLGADTAAVYLHDRASDMLVPTAAYRVPREHLETLARTPLPLGEQQFRQSIWNERRPVFSDDVAHDARFSHELFRRLHHQTGLLLPLMLGDEVAGGFYVVWWTRRRRFARRELRLLDSICRQVSLVLRNARLHGESQRGQVRLAAMNEVVRRLAAVYRTEDVLDLIANEVPRLLGVEAAGIRLREGDQLVVAARTAAAAGVMPTARLGPGEGSLSWLIVTSGEPLAVEDMATDQRFPAEAQTMVARGYRGFLGVPLRQGQEVVGVLNLYTKAPRRFDPDDTAFLSTLADQAALAIAKGNLLRRAEEGQEVLRQLSNLTLAMQRSRNVEEALGIFVRAVNEVVGFDRVVVLLLGPDGSRLECVAASGVEGPLGATFPLTAAAGPFYQAFRMRRAVAVLADADLHAVLPLDADIPRYADYRSRRFVVMPLIVGERALGVAAADNKPSRRPISSDRLEALGLLCQQLAAAIEETRLLAEARVRGVEATRLYETTRQLAEELSVDRVLDSINRGAIEILGCDAASVMRWDDQRGGLTVLRAVNLPEPLVEGFILKPGEGVAGRAFSERRPVWTIDRLAERVHYEAGQAELVAAHAPRAYLAAPIISQGEVLGVLLNFYFAPHDFQPGEVRLISTFADQAAIALRNARLYEETQAQRTRLAQILDSTADGMVLVTRDGQIQAANGRAGELLGFAPGAVVGADLQSLLGGQGSDVTDHERAASALGAVLRDPDRGGQGDIDLRRSRRTLHWTAQPTRDSAGGTVGFTLTFHDVTEEREISQMKTDFVSFVTHQLRTPLAGIRWMLELAGDEEDVPAEARSYVQDAMQAAQRLITLVNDLLDVSRLEQGRMAPVMQPVDVGDVTRSVVHELAGLIRERGHDLEITGVDGLPPVMADPQLLRQVILNLMSNAIKYTPTGGRLAIRVGASAGAVQWAVADSGIGIPRADQARLFEKFYRADNVAAVETEGAGLGLYLVRLIVEQFGGRVWCVSDEQQGATFAFTIPIEEIR